MPISSGSRRSLSRVIYIAYCYSGSKKEVSERDSARREAASRRYEHEKTSYASARTKHDSQYAAWQQKRNICVGSGNLGCALTVGAAVVFYYIAAEIAKGWGEAGVVIAFILWSMISSRIEQIGDSRFCSVNPEPKFDKTEPKLSSVISTYHSPHDHDGSSPSSTNYREEILHRDNLTCQACGKNKQRRNLEDHHIVPRSKGGTDDPTNLVTLCKYRHDREDWYEHVRAYPTTIKKPRSRFRAWRHRK